MEAQTPSDEVKKNEVKKKSIFSTTSAALPTSQLLGICNFDLMPIILGEQHNFEIIEIKNL